MTNKVKRAQIVGLKTAGATNNAIVKQLKVCRKTVYNVWKQFQDTGTSSSKPIPGRKRSIRTKSVVSAVKKKMIRNPQRSVRRIAKEAGISRSSMQRIVKEDLELRPYKKQSRQLISEPSKKKRLDRGNLILQEMKRAAGKVLIWSDEKMFTVEAVTNKQNDRVYAHSPGDLSVNVRSHLRRQKPTSVMVWAAVASDGRKSPLVVIDEGVKVNSQVYLNMLKEKVLPWLTESFGNDYIFTQDGAPAHTANVTQKWCKDNFKGFWDKTLWPPSSPDINPMDFAIWSILESDVSSRSYPNLNSLNAAIHSAWAKLDEEVVRRSCASVTSRIKLMIKAKGGHFEI